MLRANSAINYYVILNQIKKWGVFFPIGDALNQCKSKDNIKKQDRFPNEMILNIVF